MKIHRYLTLEQGLALVRGDKKPQDFGVFVLALQSTNAQLFLVTTACQCCGLRGTHFRVQSNGCYKNRLNLYAATAHGEQLLTRDHIVPRSLSPTIFGLANANLLCQQCNAFKQDALCTLSWLREFRQKVLLAVDAKKVLRGRNRHLQQTRKERKALHARVGTEVLLHWLACL